MPLPLALGSLGPSKAIPSARAWAWLRPPRAENVGPGFPMSMRLPHLRQSAGPPADPCSHPSDLPDPGAPGTPPGHDARGGCRGPRVFPREPAGGARGPGGRVRETQRDGVRRRTSPLWETGRPRSPRRLGVTPCDAAVPPESPRESPGLSRLRFAARHKASASPRIRFPLDLRVCLLLHEEQASPREGFPGFCASGGL